jgi:hypothetical protein
MKWIPYGRKNYVAARLRVLNGELARIEREIFNLDRFIAHPRRGKPRTTIATTRLLESAPLPDSKKRFISYLSAGSFQTIALRKHEQRSAKIRTVILVIAVITLVFLLLYGLLGSLFG